MSNFRGVTLSYKNAPVTIRDKVALSENQIKAIYSKAKDLFTINELFIISTCNRTEVYYSADISLGEELIKVLLLEKNITDFDLYLPYFTFINDHSAAVEHLFNVSIGLESQVVGDIQIINQIKNAYQWCADAQMAGPFLHRLLHTIFFCNKRVVQETQFRDGAASVSYATIDMMEHLVLSPHLAKVLVVGLGEIGADLVDNLADSKFENICIVNRTYAKAEELAHKHQIRCSPYENLWSEVDSADIIISSVSVVEPLITKEKLSQLDIVSHKFVFDLSMPRSVESDIEKINGVLLYNIDNIQARATEALEIRLSSIPQVRAIISQAIHDFEVWEKEME
ncbi:MAG TPA: glutamyl-tRNA reductase, partial [Cytophagales bacterium]|nr:glutamyl-tRNA reductase [Cytophagales bacterium]